MGASLFLEMSSSLSRNVFAFAWLFASQSSSLLMSSGVTLVIGPLMARFSAILFLAFLTVSGSGGGDLFVSVSWSLELAIVSSSCVFV